MKCQNCQFESEMQFDFCANCGAPTSAQETPPVEPVSLNPAADVVFAALKDKLFLVLCIVMSVAVGIQVLAFQTSVIPILITIFLWLTFASAKKGFADEKQLRNISGTVYAEYVITNVGSILLIVCGALTGVAMPLALSKALGDTELIKEVTDILVENGLPAADLAEITAGLTANELEMFGMILGIAVGVALVLTGVAMLVFNILGMKKIHKFIKSVYTGIMFQNPNFEKPKAVRGWLIFFAVCFGISAISSLATVDVTAIIANGCFAAAVIITVILLDKYFIPKNV